MTPQDHQFAKERAAKLATNISCTTESTGEMMRCLLDQMPKSGQQSWTLVSAQWNIVSDTYFDAPFAPVVDGVFLTDTPQNLMKSGKV